MDSTFYMRINKVHLVVWKCVRWLFAIPAVEGCYSGPISLLSSTIPAQVIAKANRKLQEATSIRNKRTECGPYMQYSASVYARIGECAQSPHGGIAAALYFFKKLNRCFSETAVQFIRSSHTEGV